MIEILTVCTGNICRSPLAEIALRHRLAAFSPFVSSAGTHADLDTPMTPDAQRLAVDWGLPAAEAAAHRSRLLMERQLISPDLILTMSRAQRRVIADLAPSRQRATFTIREFARAADAMTDAELTTAAGVSPDPSERMRAMAAAVSARRSAVRLRSASSDDVLDPYGRPWEEYLRSAAQLGPAIDAVVRVVELTLSPIRQTG